MGDYQAFAYPPNYNLARLHQEATKPGKIDNSRYRQCPCCCQPARVPLDSWSSRSIDQDFRKYGGAVVTYFWLVKIYGFMCGLVFFIYSIYLLINIYNKCTDGICSNLLGIWIITNENLYDLMVRAGETTQITVLYTLRGIAFLILIIGNTFSLYYITKFKESHQAEKGVADFAVLFKNVKISMEQLTLHLKQEFPEVSIKEIVAIKTMEPYYTLWNQKIEKYYECLIEQKPKKIKKALKQLQKLDKACLEHEKSYEEAGDRVIAVFNSEELRRDILKKYTVHSSLNKLKLLLGRDQDIPLYCIPCPIPQQIIWNNIGQNERQNVKMNIISLGYFVVLLAASYLILVLCMEVVYKDVFVQPLNFIISNFILLFMVIIALTFRVLMNKLSEMRGPSTQTDRTMFIVMSTVVYHFIYYLIIPTVYLYTSMERGNKILFVITLQMWNFLLVQFILAGIDLMYCCWNKNLKKICNQQKPVGCQKLLHERMQYPRFPIEFKLIILFKLFSFITFLAFEVPSMLFVTFVLMVFLYWKDKHSVYYHYRMEIIDNSVQFKFLKIYSNFYSLYIYLIFALTHENEIELYVSLAITLFFVLVQMFFIKETSPQKLDEMKLPLTFDELEIKDSYRTRYNGFRENISNDAIDLEISEYLDKHGSRSMRTEDSLKQNIL